MSTTPASWDERALETARLFTSDTDPQGRAKLQVAVLAAMCWAAPSAERALTDDAIDVHLDAVLRASGSALRHYTMASTREGMRQAMRHTLWQLVRFTPAAEWRVKGETDPHAGHFDGARAQLALGYLTDDELANGLFMNYDQKLDINAIMTGKPGYHPPISWATAAKERIRWLSRALVAAQAANLKGLQALEEVESLQGESTGVAGLHLNGDVAPWDELNPGGPFERLTTMQEALDALRGAAAKTGVLEDWQGNPRTLHIRITHEGSKVVCRPGEVRDMVQGLEGAFRLEDVWLSAQELETLPEFSGW